jgi:hypothetical protein
MGKSQVSWGKGTANLDLVATSFKKFTYYFWNALASELKAFSADQHSCTLLQYVDDLLLGGLHGRYTPSPFSFMGGRIQSL